MGFDTYGTVWKQLLLRVPQAPPLLAQDWVKNSFRRINERRLWSFDVAFQQMLFHDEVTAGTVTVTFNSNQVVGDATAAAAWTAALVGRQFRLGLNYPILDVVAFDGVNTLTLGDVWGGSTLSAQSYEIYNAYQTMPANFKSFQSVWDPTYNWALWTNKWTQPDLNLWDAQRASAGNPYTVVFRDFDPTGVTSPPQARYEIWPHRKSQYVLPYLYIVQPPDLNDAGATLPRLIRGDVVLEGALVDAASWPGPDPDHRNPYYSQLNLRYHQGRFDSMVGELERQDDELFEQDTRYQYLTAPLPWAPFPGDARYWQTHLLGSGSGIAYA